MGEGATMGSIAGGEGIRDSAFPTGVDSIARDSSTTAVVGSDASFDCGNSLINLSSTEFLLNVDVRRRWKPLKRAPGLGDPVRSLVGELDLDDDILGTGEEGREFGFGELEREPNILSELCGSFPYEAF